MSTDVWADLQELLIWVFAPVLQWWWVLVLAGGILSAIYQPFLTLLRWLSQPYE